MSNLLAYLGHHERATQWLKAIVFNADRRYVKPLGPMRGFQVVRDPRDIVGSAHFSHLYRHPDYPKLVEHRERLRSSSTEDVHRSSR